MGNWSMGVKAVRLEVPVGDDDLAVRVGDEDRCYGEGGIGYRVTKRNMVRTPSSIITQCTLLLHDLPHLPIISVYHSGRRLRLPPSFSRTHAL